MKSEFFRGRRWIASAAMVAALAVTGFYGLRAAESNPAPTIKTAARSEAAAGRGYSAVVKRVVPAVVNISTSKMVKQTAMEMPDGSDDMFRQFFGNGRGFQTPRPRAEKALGSGVIISPQGYILTNNHVVDGATVVTVTLHDKREFKARVVGTDPRTDIAVLKIEGANFPTLTLADSSKVEVGDIVLAIGDPFGVGQTVTAGIVSATGRGNLGIEQVEDFIQTDAPINPGNSGGALVDDEGHLIGINTAILAGNSGGNQGIGFAVPINMARHDMDEILAHGKVEHGYLGILPQDVTPALAKAFHAETNGALVGEVTPDSPAAHSSLKQGDIIVAVNGQPITDAGQLRTKIGMMDPNQTVTLKVLRNGTTQDVAVTLGEYPSKEEHASVNKSDSNSSLSGVNVESLTPETAQELKLPATTKGVVVSEVDPSSHAADAGLKPGDVIQQVNRKPVTNMRDYTEAVGAAKRDDSVLLLVNRGGNTLFLAV
ncbi:MAG TPA: DegQ family serine endoprotease [Bryobacteraceae bacterium]|jgi:serine protease Do|nr:DegQ family serine endoprotease [Bryobacteraceae bacterium]